MSADGMGVYIFRYTPIRGHLRTLEYTARASARTCGLSADMRTTLEWHILFIRQIEANISEAVGHRVLLDDSYLFGI